MPDLLNTSLTGMLAFQRALQVTSHNIANANTPGYSRQVAEFSTRIGSGGGNTYVGGGTQISQIRRMYDSLLGGQLQTATTSQARFSALNDLAGRIDSLLADADTGLNDGLQALFNAVQDVSNDPASIPTRQALLGEADSLVNRFRTIDNRLDELASELNSRLSLAVTDINRLASAIADVNDQIVLTNGSSQPPNDLLDKRDGLVRELAGFISVSTVIQEDGAMNVFIGSGQALVMSGMTQQLDVRGDEFDPTRVSVVFEGTGGATSLDGFLSGGAVGGLLEFRSRMLDPARQSLGQTAVAFAEAFNAQHAAGMDLRGNVGAAMFGVAPPAVLDSSDNTGSGSAIAGLADVAALTGADYVLEFDGASYSLTRADTNEVIAMTGSGTLADPFAADGLTIEVAGSPAAGDRFLVRSGQAGAGSIEALISDPQGLALAAPTRSELSVDNIGNATVSPASVVDATDPGLLTTSVIEFTSPTTYSINGTGSFAYNDGDPIVINGSSITISGVPAIGDQFTIEANFGASADNSNGLLLSGLQSKGVLDGGTISINENYSRLVSSVGGTTSQIQAGLDAQDVILANVEDAMRAKSGVNLDEEAARLLRYQQAYQAVAQVVAVTRTLFDTLINATGR